MMMMIIIIIIIIPTYYPKLSHILVCSYVCNANMTAVGSYTIDRTIEMSEGKFKNTTRSLQQYELTERKCSTKRVFVFLFCSALSR